MSLFLQHARPERILSPQELKELTVGSLRMLGARRKVLAVPPDRTRLHSRAGEITEYVYSYYGANLKAILPALGTHARMESPDLDRMFSGIPHQLFRHHDWRRDVVTLGEVPSEFVYMQSEGKLNYSFPAQLNRLIVEGGFDLVLSIGQVVPHEVIGMANHSKNLLIGTGGRESINRSHYLGAVYGMERIMGRADNPVRRVLNYASDHFLLQLPIIYVLTVIGRDAQDKIGPVGLFVGDDRECFIKAAELSLKMNFVMLQQPLDKVVVFLDPHEFKSTWLGNKSIYRTRMAVADRGELIVLAPGVKCFGEDPGIDSLIRKFGYFGTGATQRAVETSPELAEDLSAAAHLIHGSSEDRFRITYCPGGLTRDDVENVGFGFRDLKDALREYDPTVLRPGWNQVSGENIYFISNPGLGLWAYSGRFAE
jgi:nickel-dependent lactate racemase